MVFDSSGRAVIRPGARRWSLAAAGDLCAIGRVGKALCEVGHEAMLDERLRALLAGVDARLVNLESPICDHPNPIPKTGPNFMASPRVLPALLAAGFDVMAMANNHVLDQGVSGLRETLEHLDEHEIGHSGAGLTHPEARKAHRRTIGGARVSFLTVAEGEFAQAQEEGPGTARLDPVRTCRDIEGERQSADIVVLSVHAGNEYQPFPSPMMQGVYRDFVDAGAHVVVGHHPHIPQGVERRGDGIILYSLGNFLFDYEGHKSKPCTQIGFVAVLEFDDQGVCGLSAHPFRMLADASVGLLDGESRRSFTQYLNDTSAPLGDPERLRALWEQEAVALFDGYRGWLLKAAAAFAPETPDYQMSYIFYNLVRCEAHHEALKTAFRLMYERRFRRDPSLQEHVAAQIRRLEALAGA